MGLTHSSGFYSFYYLKRSKKLNLFAIFACVFFLITIFIIVYSIVLNAKGSIFSSRKYYLLSLYQTQNKQMAINAQESIVNSGGAGYLYSYQNEICVLGFVYLKEKAASSVLEANLISFENSSIIALNAEKISLKYQRLIKANNLLLTSFRYISSITEEIYNLCISYETGEIDIASLYRQIEVVSLRFKEVLLDLDDLQLGESDEEQLKDCLYLSLSVNLSNITSCKDEIYKGLKIEKALKLVCIKTCLEEIDLRKRINKL